MAMVFFKQRKMQFMLKRLCRAIQFCSTTALLIFIIYVYYTSGGTQWNGAPQWVSVLRPGPTHAECSLNMFTSRKGCLPCPRGTFSFLGCSECTSWLNCSEIALQVHPIRRLTGGRIEGVWLSDWKGHQVVFISCSATNARKRNSCKKGMSIIEQIQGEFITRLIGRCPEKLQVSQHEYSNITDCSYLNLQKKKSSFNFLWSLPANFFFSKSDPMPLSTVRQIFPPFPLLRSSIRPWPVPEQLPLFVICLKSFRISIRHF